MRINIKKVGSLIVLSLFIISVVVVIIPQVYESLRISSLSLGDIEVIDIDSGDNYKIKNFRTSKMLFIVYDGAVGEEVDRIAELLNELGVYIESKGYRVVVVVSGDSLNNFREYLAANHPLVLNKYRWLYDPHGLVSSKFGSDSGNARIYIVYSDWSFKFVGDTRTPPVVIMDKLSR